LVKALADLRPQKQLPPSDRQKSMSNQQNHLKSRKIIVFGLLTAILLTIWSINRQKETSKTPENSNLAQSESKTSIKSWLTKNQNEESSEIQQRLSLGDKILISADNNPDKQSAVEKFAAGDFLKAQLQFTNSLKAYPNDPEALIYLNNSLAATDAAIDLETIKIGVSIPVGGSLDVAQEILRGVAQAQNEINKEGGIEQDGTKKLVQVQIANDDNDPEIAQQIAANFVADPKILGVVGHNSSDASMAAAPIYQQGNLVMISPTSVARELSQAGSYIFRTTPSSRVLAETLAQYSLDNLHLQKIAVCADSKSPASMSFKEEFSLAVFESGGEITSTNCDFASEKFNPDETPSKAIADGSEALLLIPSVDKINQALEVTKANQNRLTILGNHSMYTYETLNIGQSDVNSMIIPTVWHPHSTAKSDFNKNARELWGMEGSWRTATAYDATKALFAGLALANTRPQLQQTLANSGFIASGALGKITFQPSGDRQTKATLVKIQPGNSSGTGYDFKPINSEQLTVKSKK
jgi:branched-chain amino acid transport system substrate-binding protein